MRRSEDLGARLPEGPVRAIITDNLADELGDDHPGLWRAFAEALGVRSGALDAAAPEPETAACVDAFSEATAHASPSYALGMLYAYESQTPEVATTKVAGLKQHYGIRGTGLAYFELHGALDVEHTRELGRALEQTVEDPSEAVAGATAGAEAIWGLLDGVARVRGIG